MNKLYNPEVMVLALIKKAHEYKGLFHASRILESGGVWLSLVFEDTDAQTAFNGHVHEYQMCKAMQLGDKGTCMTHVLV